MERKRVGIWLRVSTMMQVEQTDSLEHHEKRARAYCEAKEWEIVKIYRVEAVSDKIVFDHPSMIEMLEDIKSGVIDTLVFSSLSRLARNTKQLLQISDLFQEQNASLVSLKESIDTSSPAGRLFFTLLSALATFEVEELSERVKASVVTRAKMGKTLGGAAPFGFKYVDKKLILDEKEAPIRKEAFEIFLETKRKKTTARILNEKGYRTRKGSKFSDSTIGRMLTDTIAKGLKKSNYTSSTGDGKHWDLKDPSEWIYTEVPAIVDEELFDKVNNIITLQKGQRKQPKRLPVHPFSGLVYCGCDNVSMRVLSSTPTKYTCPSCRSKIAKDDLENIYKEQLKVFMLSPKKMKQYLSKANTVIEEKEKQLKILKDAEAKTHHESKKLYDLYMSDALSVEGFKRSNTALDERLTEFGNTIPKLTAEIDILKNQILNESEMSYNGKTLYEKWDTFLDGDKIAIIKNLTEKIVVRKNEVLISLFFIPSIVNGGNMATELHSFIAIMPPLEFTLERPICGSPKKLSTIGNHLRKRRLTLKLTQDELAHILKVTTQTLRNWEKEDRNIAPKHYPNIVSFLNYCPLESYTSLGSKIKLFRKYKGLTHRDLASLLEISPSKVERWEADKSIPKDSYFKRIIKVLSFE